MKQASGDDPDAPEYLLSHAMNDSPDWRSPMDHIAFVNFYWEIPFRCRFMDENFILEPGIGRTGFPSATI